MNKEIPSDDQKQKLREELIAKFIAFWIEDNDYLDLMFNKIATLITENDDYGIFATDEILFDALGGSSADGEIIIEDYFYSGKIKDWISFHREIQIHLEDKPGPNDCGLGSYIFESKKLIVEAIHGLARSLSRGEINSDDQEKLIPLLQNFQWKINDLPDFYIFQVICYGLIGSTKSLPFLKKILEEIDNVNLETRDLDREFHNDNFHFVRIMVVKAIAKINGKNGANYLIERFKKEPSPSVQQIIIFELKKFDIPDIFDGLKEYKQISDLETNFSKYTKKFVLADFDESYKEHI